MGVAVVMIFVVIVHVVASLISPSPGDHGAEDPTSLARDANAGRYNGSDANLFCRDEKISDSVSLAPHAILQVSGPDGEGR
jgi:hypothetical protein